MSPLYGCPFSSKTHNDIHLLASSLAFRYFLLSDATQDEVDILSILLLEMNEDTADTSDLRGELRMNRGMKLSAAQKDSRMESHNAKSIARRLAIRSHAKGLGEMPDSAARRKALHVKCNGNVHTREFFNKARERISESLESPSLALRVEDSDKEESPSGELSGTATVASSSRSNSESDLRSGSAAGHGLVNLFDIAELKRDILCSVLDTLAQGGGRSTGVNASALRMSLEAESASDGAKNASAVRAEEGGEEEDFGAAIPIEGVLIIKKSLTQVEGQAETSLDGRPPAKKKKKKKRKYRKEKEKEWTGETETRERKSHQRSGARYEAARDKFSWL